MEPTPLSLTAPRYSLLFLRTKNNLTQAQLAKLAKVATQSICHWERGTTFPSPRKRAALEKLFNCKIDWDAPFSG